MSKQNTPRFVRTLLDGKKNLYNLKFTVAGVSYQMAGIGETALKLKIPSPTPRQDSFSFINWEEMGPEETDIVEFLLDYLSSP